jgi:choline-sulfatase
MGATMTTKCLSWVLVAMVGLMGEPVMQAGERPNVLFLFADDYSFEALGAVGLVDVETPNLDKLSARSVRFSHAYNMGSWSGAVCVASRAMLNTGRYLWRASAVDKQLGAEAAAGRMWSQMMKGAGYRTFMTGKWHVSYAAEKLFDETANVRAGMPKTVESSYNRPLPGVPDGWSPSDRSLGGFWEGGKHWSEVTADDAIGYLEKGKGAKEPFFMYVAFNAPHDPRQAPESFGAKYPKERVKVPTNFLPEYPYAEAMGAGKGLRDEKLAPFPRTEEAVKVHRGEYLALITHLDEQVGRVLAALEASGEAERTWVFFTADHGLAVGHHGLMGKQNLYEASLRVPFLAAGPGVKPGVVEAPIYLQDAMATALDVAGVKKPEHVEFQSLLPLIRGESTRATAEPVYGAYLQLQRAVIADGLKLVVYPKAGVVRLFDLKADPEEMKDLAEVPEMKGKRAALLAKLREVQAAMGDALDLGKLGQSE